MVDEWTGKINEAIPGVYDEDSEVGSELAETAKELGFDSGEYLEIMTDPRTLVIPHGQQETFFLGPGVMGLLNVLYNAKQKISSDVNEDDLRVEIEKELEPKIVERVTKELTEKLEIPEEEVKLIMVNGIAAKWGTLLQGDERVALFPPVGGG